MKVLTGLYGVWTRGVRAGRVWLVAVPVLLTACVPPGEVPEVSGAERDWEAAAPPRPEYPPERTGAILRERRFQEAPGLAREVAEGRLPPVAERLPENPLVVFPLEETGVYGGGLRRVTSADVGYENTVKRTMVENLMAWERPVPTEIIHNLAEAHAYHDEGARMRVRLRAGIRWSDGHPFTVDDILFWYEDTVVDEEGRDPKYPFFPPEWMQEGRPLRLERVDAHTLDIIGSQPLGRLPEVLTGNIIALPKHYFAPHHPRYNPEANYADFRRMSTDAQLTYQPGIPRLTAWVPTTWNKGRRVVYERNPYYWKIDPEGNQLPYADRLTFEIVPNAEIRLFKFINGEVDIMGDIPLGNAYPTLRAYASSGRFSVRYSPPRPFYALAFNWDTPDPRLRAAFRNRDVRIAVSHAINRDEINRIVGHGLLVPSGYSLGPDSPFFCEEQFFRYAEYDPARSAALLDAAGYTDRNGDGYRQFADGSRFEVTIDFVVDRGVGTGFLELVREYLEAVGIRTHLNFGMNNIIMERRTTGVFEILARRQPTNLLDQIQHFGAVGPNFPFWHPHAVSEGPEWLRRATEHLRLAHSTINPEERRRHAEIVRDLHVENIPMVSLGAQREVFAVHQRIGNAPATAVLDTSYRGWERPVFHEQLFIRRSP